MMSSTEAKRLRVSSGRQSNLRERDKEVPSTSCPDENTKGESKKRRIEDYFPRPKAAKKGAQKTLPGPSNDRQEVKRLEGLTNRETHDQHVPDVTVIGVTGGNVKNAYTVGVVHGNVGQKSKLLHTSYNKVRTKKMTVSGRRTKIKARSVKIKERRVKTDDTELANRKGQMYEWIQTDSDVFQETAGFNVAKRCLDTHGHVTITGEAGSGKTSIGRHLLRTYKNEFQCLVIENVAEMKRFRNPKVPTLLLVNDVFGRSAYLQTKVMDWRNGLEAFRDRLPETMKIIFTSRTFIFQEASPKLVLYKHSIFRENTIVDLSADILLPSDKEKILSVHTKKAKIALDNEDIKEVVNMNASYGFPLACCIFSKIDTWHDKPREFFERPIEAVIESVKDLADYDQDKFALLLLVLLEDGELNPARFNQDTQMLKKIKMFMTNYDVQAFVNKSQVIVDSLIDSYLISTGDTLSFRHQTVEDAVAVVLGKTNAKFLIENCPMRVLHERVRIDTSREGNTRSRHSDKFHIVLPDMSHVALITRFASEIGDGELCFVALHQACTNEAFVENLFLFLQKSKNQTLSQILKETRDGGLVLLSWSALSKSAALCTKILEISTHNMFDIMDAIELCCGEGNGQAMKALVHQLSSGVRKHLQLYPLTIEYEDVKMKHVERFLDAASYNGHIEVVKFLVELESVVNPDDYMNSALHFASVGGHDKVMTYLLEKGAEIDWKSTTNEHTALHSCCQHGHLPALKICVTRRANIETRDKNKLTPLLTACKEGLLDIVEYLIKEKADIEAKDKSGKSALLTACMHGHEDIVKFLMKKGASVNEKDHSDRTLLHFACLNGLDKTVNDVLDKMEPGSKDMFPQLLRLSATKSSSNREDSKHDIATRLIDMGATVNSTDEKKMTPLLLAAESGYMKLFILLRQNGADLKVKDWTGQTILHKLAKRGLHSLLKEVIPHVKNLIDYMDDHNQTPLHLAARWGGNEVIQVLMENGADIDKVNNRRQTPLHIAAEFGQGVQLLVEANASVKASEANGQTPLHLAAKTGNISNIRTLLDKKSDVNGLDLQKQTPLHLAAEWGDVKPVKILIKENADIQAEDASLRTPLHTAASIGASEVVELLLEKGSNVNVVDDQDLTPLHLAADNGDLKTVQVLIDNDADVNASDKSGMTPLHKVDSVQEKTVAVLLRNNADVNARTVEKLTPLHLFAETEMDRQTSKTSFQHLLKHNAQVDAQDFELCSPLHLAAACGNVVAVEMLIDQKALVSGENLMKMTALHFAAENGNDLIVQLLLDNEADIEAVTCEKQTPLHLASAEGFTKTVRVLLDNKANVDAADSWKQTPLHLAAEEEEFDTVQALVDHHANVNVIDELQKTPLHAAAEQNKPETLKILLTKKADVHAVDQDGCTPLHLAAMSGKDDNIQVLLDHGADLHAEDKGKNTPFHLAKKAGMTETADLLSEKSYGT